MIGIFDHILLYGSFLLAGIALGFLLGLILISSGNARL